MASSIGTKQYGSMTDYQFKELLDTITAVLGPVKSAATFYRTPWQASTEKGIY